MRIDHVTVAGRDLETLSARYRALGFEVVYGGAHSNGVTHMAVVTFADGSYLELISTIEPGRADSPWWGRHIAGDGGPCAWAVETDDVAAEAARVASLGIPVRGPVAMHRARPDGQVAAWTLAHLGEGEPGATLPFVIRDTAPRELRVPPSAEGGPGAVMGVAEVMLGVADLDEATALFRRVYGWPEPVVSQDARLGARVARFENTPVALVDRVGPFGPSPLAFTLEVRDVDAARERFGLGPNDVWIDDYLAIAGQRRRR